MNALSRGERVWDLGIVAVMVVYGTLTIALFWERPYLVALLMLPPPLILGMRLHDPGKALVLALTGAVLAPLTEMACVAGGLWTYADTGGISYVPPWNFPAWACFPPALWLGARALLGTEVSEKSDPRSLATAILGICLMIAVFVSFGKSNGSGLIAGILMVAALAAVDRRQETVAVMGIGALLGPVCESLPISSGAWWYAASPQVLGLPAYMILAYAVFAALVWRASQAALALVPGNEITGGSGG